MSKSKNTCGFCRRGKEVNRICGPLHSTDDCSAHHRCMKCSICKSGSNGKEWKKRGGATAGCAIKKCKKTFHYYCAKLDKSVITKRIEVTSRDKEHNAKKMVMYRVFCSEEHQKMFEQEELNELRYLNESESSESDSDEDSSESDDDMKKNGITSTNTQSDSLKTLDSQGSNASPNVHITQLSIIESPRKFKFSVATSPKSKTSMSKSNEENLSIEGLMYNSGDNETESTESTDCTSGTSAKDLQTKQKSLDLSTSLDIENCTLNEHNKNKKATRSKTKIIKSHDSPSGSDDKHSSICTARRSLNSEFSCDTSNNDEDISEIKGRMLGTITPLSKKVAKVTESSQGNDRKILTEVGKVFDKRTNNDASFGSSSLEPKSKRLKLESSRETGSPSKSAKRTDRKSKKSTDTESEGYGSSQDMETEKLQMKAVNSKLPKYFKDIACDNSPENCVLCIVEQASSGTAYNKIITPIATTLYGVSKDSVYLWKYQAEEGDITVGHMVYLLKDISRALREGNLTAVSNLLCSLDGQKIEDYDNFLKLNTNYSRETKHKLYYKLRQNIRDNLFKAVEKMKAYIGSFHFFKTLSCHVMFLQLSELTDPKREVRNMLGHKRKPYSLSLIKDNDVQLSCAENVPLSEHTRIYEFDVLLEWMKENVHKPRILTRPNPKESYLTSSSVQSVTLKLKKELEEKSTDANDAMDVVFIGPVNHEIINVWPYLQKCLPAIIEDRLTVLNDIIYVVYDVDNLQFQSIKSLIPVFPSHIEVKVLCGIDPETSPISCVVLQLSFNPDLVIDDDFVTSKKSNPREKSGKQSESKKSLTRTKKSKKSKKN